MPERRFRENNRNSSSHPPPLGQKSKPHRIPKAIAWFAAFTFVTALFSCYPTVDARPGKDNDFWNGSFEHDDDKETMETIVNIIVGVVVFFFVAVAAFIACLCCPICLLAKMRGRRRGVVYRSAVTTDNGTTVTTQQNRGGTVITVTGPPRPQQQQNVTPVQTVPTYSSANNNPSVIAISNAHQQQSKPYPVQESVTVVPVISTQQAYPHPQMMSPAGYPPAGYPPAGYPPQQQVPYQYQPQFDAAQSQPQQYPGPADPPPPYPGLTREIDANKSPYNPYYTEGAHQASAPPSAPPSKY